MRDKTGTMIGNYKFHEIVITPKGRGRIMSFVDGMYEIASMTGDRKFYWVSADKITADPRSAAIENPRTRIQVDPWSYWYFSGGALHYVSPLDNDTDGQYKVARRNADGGITRWIAYSPLHAWAQVSR